MAFKAKNSFDRLMQFDDQIISLYNSLQKAKFSILGQRKKYKLRKNTQLKDIHRGQRCFIVGNGPSIKQQDLTLLKNEYSFFVNHFYKHPKITKILPSYYTIIDPKLITGEWPLSMLDEIQTQCPQARLFLSARYQDTPGIVKRAEQFEHYWLYPNQLLHKGFPCPTDISRCFGGSNVITACLFAAIHMGFKDIYLLGIDCDGIFRDLVDQSSHFYEADKENIGDNDPELVVRHLRMSIQGLRGWQAIADTFADSPHNIVNLTQGGLLNVFPRADLGQIVMSSQAVAS